MANSVIPTKSDSNTNSKTNESSNKINSKNIKERNISESGNNN